MIGLRGRRATQRAPEPRQAISRFAPHHTLGTDVHRRVRIELEKEHIAVLGRRGGGAEARCLRHSGILRTRGLREHSEHPQEFDRRCGRDVAPVLGRRRM